MNGYDIFTSESVSNGHPDKLADRISDAVLDAYLTTDPDARVACETLVKSELIVIAGEVRSTAEVDIEHIARKIVRDTGYTEETGMDPDGFRVESVLNEQSQQIAKGVDETAGHPQGAGDQGMMFGYATTETEVLMPAPITYSHRLMKRQAEVRDSDLPFLGPDAKCQLTFRYSNGSPISVDTIVFSTQHAPNLKPSTIEDGVRELIIKEVIPTDWLTSDTKCLINPAGEWEFKEGGPRADCGLTGRKIIVDTYGGMAHHGGGAFSGKDPSKVDRSAAYAVRHVAKNIVAAKLAKRCEVQVSYAIGRPDPTSISLNTFGTSDFSNKAILDLVHEHFDLRPKELIQNLKLKRPIYSSTAAFGHFGREEDLDIFTWERKDVADRLRLE
ncbi:MAG: methionine adenosyltransferase [Gammaproteobacteria bacterium]|nr:methionine adenosyltransferase [Gammaproteobacteria bacterium]MYC25270.1 methionine adenosyltransferase [Gammaproteobacteria bacterium]